jgi:hypothetical protein
MSIAAIASHFVAGPPADPISILGDALLAWYSADAEAAYYANGAQITTLHDLSGHGNDAVGVAGSGGAKPLFRTAGGPSGGPSIEFQSLIAGAQGGYFTLFPNDLLSGMTSGEAWATVRSDVTQTSLWNFGYDGGGEQAHYPYGASVYESLGRFNRFSWVPTQNVAAWQRYSAWAAATTHGARFNGAVDAATPPGVAGGQLWWPAIPLLGRSTTGTAMNFGGRLSSFIFVSRSLTAGEVSALDAWSAANPSGGLQLNPPTLSLSAFRAKIASLGPLAHYKMNETSGTTMTDDSGNNRHGTYTGATLNSAGMLPGHLSDGSMLLANDTAQYATIPYGAWMDWSEFAFSFIWTPTANVENDESLLNRYPTSNSPWYVQRDAANKLNLVCKDGGAGTRSTGLSPATVANQRYLVCGRVTPTTLHLYLDGTQVSKGTKSAGFSYHSGQDITVGRYLATSEYTPAAKIQDLTFYSSLRAVDIKELNRALLGGL